jgi:hypothetical protein
MVKGAMAGQARVNTRLRCFSGSDNDSKINHEIFYSV